MALIGNPIVVGYNNAGQGQGYGSCTTSNQATAQKAVTLSDYNLQIGGIVAVKFPYNNTATSISLNINNKGAKPVLYRGSASIDATLINAGDIATFIYDGTSYHLISVDRWGNSPDFKGTPTAPTAAVDTNTDQIATTKFVQNQIANTGSDDLSNDSDVDGNTISDALETLSSAENITYDNSLATHTAGSVGAEVKSLHDSIDALGSDDIANDSSSVSGATVTAALDNLQDSIDDVEDITGDGQLSGFTATDLTGAANELKGSLNTSCLRAAVATISANGTSSNTLTGLTADHVVGNWGMFSDANCTTPIPENSPTCDITITTAANAWSVTIANFSSTFYLRPTFILKQN